MTTRTRRSMAYFEAPFTLRVLDGIQPVGDDDINEDENIIEGLSLASLSARSTFIHIRPGMPTPQTQLFGIAHPERETAIKKIRRQSHAHPPAL